MTFFHMVSCLSIDLEGLINCVAQYEQNVRIVSALKELRRDNFPRFRTYPSSGNTVCLVFLLHFTALNYS